MRYLLPLGIFLALAALLGAGLTLNPREVPSPFIGKPAPALDLPGLHEGSGRVSGEALKGQPWVLNVWASWCLECRREHALLSDFARRSPVPLVGLNYKDAEDDAKRWLVQFGDPFDAIAVDAAGDTGIEWGVYGVPETFVIDARGVVRYKHIGAVDAAAMRDTIEPLVERLANES